MSMHKVPLTQLEEDGLAAHRLPIGTPSQLSDVFRQGMKWAIDHCPNCVSEANIDEVPLFRQGSPNHEVEELVTADRCNWLVERFRAMVQIIKKYQRNPAVALSPADMDFIEASIQNPLPANEALRAAVLRYKRNAPPQEQLLRNLELRYDLAKGARTRFEAEPIDDENMLAHHRGQELEAWNSLQAAKAILNDYDERKANEGQSTGNSAS